MTPLKIHLVYTGLSRLVLARPAVCSCTLVTYMQLKKHVNFKHRHYAPGQGERGENNVLWKLVDQRDDIQLKNQYFSTGGER